MNISDKELKRARKIAGIIRETKENNYDSYTWEFAIDKIVSEHTNNSEDFFRIKALMAFFINESIQMQSLSMFMDGLDSRIEDLKERSEHYAISKETRKMLDVKITAILNVVTPGLCKENAYDVYQMMIDKAFLTANLDDLFAWLDKLHEVIKTYYPNAFQEIVALIIGYQQIEPIIEITKTGATKKDILASIPIETDPGLFMNRLVKIGIFNQGKRGRENLYTFVSREFDNNLLRKEWTWLYSEPYKKISQKVYKKPKYSSLTVD